MVHKKAVFGINQRSFLDDSFSVFGSQHVFEAGSATHFTCAELRLTVLLTVAKVWYSELISSFIKSFNCDIFRMRSLSKLFCNVILVLNFQSRLCW